MFWIYRWQKNLQLEDAIHIALLTLKEGFDGDVTSKNIQVGLVREKKQKKKQSNNPKQVDNLKNNDDNNNNENTDVEYEFVTLSEKELQDYLDQIS